MEHGEWSMEHGAWSMEHVGQGLAMESAEWSMGNDGQGRTQSRKGRGWVVAEVGREPQDMEMVYVEC